MTNDVRNARSDGRRPRPLALGWKLESGTVPTRDLQALCAAMTVELGAVNGRARWMASPALRAFFAEYDRVHGASRRRTRPRCVRPRVLEA